MGRSRDLWALLAAAALAVILTVVIWIAHTRLSGFPPKAALTAEEGAYLQHIVVTEARMSAAKNFLGDMVTYLDAKLTNTGAKKARELELRLEFVDTLNQVVLREAAHPITLRTPPLKPGETRALHVTFEHMPVDWNLAPPTITPTRVRF